MLKGASAPVILVGSEYLQYDQSPQILQRVEKLAFNLNAGILPLPAQNNLLGTIMMGTYPELLPGGFSSGNRKKIEALRKAWGADIPYFKAQTDTGIQTKGKKLKVLYLVGEVPSEELPQSEFLIVQNIYPPDPWHKADLALASAGFAEADGTYINGEGRIQQIRKAVNPQGEALPDWEILCRIARKMGKKGFDFTDVRKIQKEISGLVKGFGSFENPSRKTTPLVCEGELKIPQTKSKKIQAKSTKFPFSLTTSVLEHTHRGFPLAVWIKGAGKLFPEEILEINSEDAQKAGILQGDQVIVTSTEFEKTWTAQISEKQPQGTMHVTLRQDHSVGFNPHPVRIRKKNV
jgi:formate dehydrogenase alpha subunit